MNKAIYLTITLLFSTLLINNVQAAQSASPLPLSVYLKACSKDMPAGNDKATCMLMFFSALDAASSAHIIVLGAKEGELYYDHDSAAKLTYGRKYQLLYDYIDLLKERDRKKIINLDMEFIGLGTVTTMFLRDYFPKDKVVQKQRKPKKESKLELRTFSNEEGELKPIVRIEPKYPTRTARQGITGWVELSFDVDTNGNVINVAVIDAEPKRVFDREARKALRKWKFPRLQEVKTNNKVRIPFELDD